MNGTSQGFRFDGINQPLARAGQLKDNWKFAASIKIKHPQTERMGMFLTNQFEFKT